jgi:hypothetical protein
MRAAKKAPGVRALYQSPRTVPVHAFLIDTWNGVRYGPAAPRFAERLWVDTATVRTYIPGGTVWRSARVREAWPEDRHVPVDEDPVYRSAVAHWCDGLSWEESGEIDRVMATIERFGKHAWQTTREDVLLRCAQLDEMFEVIERERRIREQSEVDPKAFRQLGGISMHVGPNGEPIRSHNGRHRFAIARILGITPIPVRVAEVHRGAIPHLDALRRHPGSPTHGMRCR